MRTRLPILTLLLIVSSCGARAAAAGPLDVSQRGAAVLGHPGQAGGDDGRGTAGGGEPRDWLESRALFVRGGTGTWSAVFGDDYGTGFGVHGGFAYGWRPHVILRLSAGGYRFRADTIQGGPPTASSTLVVIPLLAGADYLLKTAGSVRPFLGAAAGPTFLKADFDDRDASFFHFANLLDAWPQVQLRGGVSILRRDSRLGIEVLGAYNMIIDDLSEFSMGEPAHHDYFELGAGITFFLEHESLF